MNKKNCADGRHRGGENIQLVSEKAVLPQKWSKGSLAVGYYRHILVGYNCHINVGYNRHILVRYYLHMLVRYKRHILVGYNCHIPWSKFEKYWTPDIHDFKAGFFGVSFCIGAIIRTRRGILSLYSSGFV